MNVQSEIDRLVEKSNVMLARAAWLRDHAEKLEQLPQGTIYDGGLDFDNLNHEQVIKVVRVLGGKWFKTSNAATANTIDYTGSVGGVKVRCYAGQPPPSCKIVEIEEVVPEQVVPAHTRKVRKMVCHPSLEASIVTAAPKENGVVQ